MVLHGVQAGGHHIVQHDGLQQHIAGAGVVEKLVNGGVQLRNVGRHVLAGVVVGHTHLGFQAQAGQRRAQVVGDAGQHHRAVLLHFGQLVGHAVEADVDFADLAGDGLFVQVSGGKVAVAHPRGGIRQQLERLVDQPRNGRCTGQRQGRGHGQPDQPGGAVGGAEAGAVHQQPVLVAVDVKPDPQALFTIHAARHHGAGPQPTGQFGGDAVAQCGGVKQLEVVTRLARNDAHTFLFGHGLDEGHTRNGVGVHQGRAAQVDKGSHLLRSLDGAGL